MYLYFMIATLLVIQKLGCTFGNDRYNCYGDFTRLSPTGASAATARGSKLSHGGVKASNKMAAEDKAEVLKRKSYYKMTAENTCISPAVIAALASRESNAGAALYRTNGWGDFRGGKYHAYGILQCDIENSGLDCTKYHWDSQQHMQMMVSGDLIGKIQCVKKKFPNWPPERQLQGGIAAYNFGCSNVRSWDQLDVGTTGGDYSNDVIARAQWFNTNVFGSSSFLQAQQNGNNGTSLKTSRKKNVTKETWVGLALLTVTCIVIGLVVWKCVNANRGAEDVYRPLLPQKI